MGLDRRTFLQRTGLAMLSLSIGESFLFSRIGNTGKQSHLKRYLQTLASPRGRKLALLVGINQYANQSLKGCVTDVELQRELLIHRFGFNPSDILTLTDDQATCQGIKDGFVEHLINQGKEDDVVVFHFSGYGRQVKIPRIVEEGEEGLTRLGNSLIPRDGIQPGEGNDLLEETLGELARALATEKVTFVLDTSYRGTGENLLGNLRVRSLLAPFSQQRAVKNPLQKPPRFKLPGVTLTATGKNQVSTEADWTGFSSGLFTYALTQYLWQITPASSIYISLQQTTQGINPWMGQQQQPYRKGEDARSPLLPYYLLPKTKMGAEGIVTAVEDDGQTLELYLGGLPGLVLEHYEVGSCLHLLPNPELDIDGEPILIQILSRTGLTAKAQLLTTSTNLNLLEAGQQVQESIRLLKNPGLVVALDLNLDRIERVDATSAFSNIPIIASTPTAGEQRADCLFGKVHLEPKLAFLPQENGNNALGLVGGYGLFLVGGVAIPNTAGGATEAVKSGIERLIPKMQTLLAMKLWRLTKNEGSSRLGLWLTLEQKSPTPNTLFKTTTRPWQSSPDIVDQFVPSQNRDLIPKVALGSHLQYQLENTSDRRIYFLLLGLDPRNKTTVFYPPLSPETTSGLANLFVAPQQTAILPPPDISVDWIVSGSRGMTEVYVICSQTPFTQTLETLAATQRPQGTRGRVVDLEQPLEVTQALWQDLHRGSAVSPELYNSTADTYALDVKAWATLSFLYQVI